MTGPIVRATVTATLWLFLVRAALAHTSAPLDLLQVFASSLVAGGLLAWTAARAPWTGGRRFAALLALAWGFGSLNNLIEAAVFRVVPADRLAGLALLGLATQALAVLLTLWSLGPRAPAPRIDAERTAAWWAVRVLACAVSYLALYVVAGKLALPHVRPFYERLGLPGGGAVALLQLAVRGPVFTLLGIVALRAAPRGRGAAIAWAALAIAGWSGVAPLLMPNPFFPDAVRWVHFVEVVGANAVFGAIVGVCFAERVEPAPA